jgi:L-arabinose isomerase
MEDYTIHFDGKKSAILQAHMLEVSPTGSKKPRLEVHPLGIGGKNDPALWCSHPKRERDLLLPY